MNDEREIPPIFNNNQTEDNPPLFTCGLKFDKYDYEKKVRSISIFFTLSIVEKHT